MKIKSISFFKVSGHWRGSGYPVGSRQAMALDIYPEFNQINRNEERGENRLIEALYLEIESDEQVSGIFGPIEEEQAYLINRFIKPFLAGRDPLATEMLHDQMLRMHRHGRSGLFITATSAVDCALWDLKGKAWGQPIYRLLGGPTRNTVPAYASMLGFPTDPSTAYSLAQEYKAKGYNAQKWFFRYGPGDGMEGKAKNLALAQAVRDAVGEGYSIMFDAYMGWDVTYALDLAKRLSPLTPFWLEEPIPPERTGSLRKIRAAGVPIATGEHVYTRWQVKELLVNEALDFIQTDPDWTGGITELVKVCQLGSAFETPVVAHGHSLLAALHVAGSQSPATVPYVEYLVQYQEQKQYFHKPIYRPEQGSVSLPDLPGMGIAFDESKIESSTRITF